MGTWNPHATLSYRLQLRHSLFRLLFPSKNMPPSWTLCQSVFVVWAVGSEGDMLPDNVGMPLGVEHGGATYFMMETHYDNPQVHKGQSGPSSCRGSRALDAWPLEACGQSLDAECSCQKLQLTKMK